MTRDKLQNLIDNYSDNSPLNYVLKKGTAANADDINFARNNLNHRNMTLDMIGADEDSGLVGMRFYQHPIFSITRADNPGFAELKRPEVVGAHHLQPEDWLPGAKTVISFFLPFERRVVEANKRDPIEPAVEWVYTRVDGQRFLLSLGAEVKNALIADGYRAIAPYAEDKFIMRVSKGDEMGAENIPPFSSNWSERHVGVVAGLGTFGLSTNFISKLGSAGRLISIVTDWDIEPDECDYDDWLGYCNRCGVCLKNCPAQAHLDNGYGKDHEKCGTFIRKVCEKHAPRYGCGKCQSGLPCEYTPMRPKK